LIFVGTFCFRVDTFFVNREEKTKPANIDSCEKTRCNLISFGNTRFVKFMDQRRSSDVFYLISKACFFLN